MKLSNEMDKRASMWVETMKLVWNACQGQSGVETGKGKGTRNFVTWKRKGL